MTISAPEAEATRSVALHQGVQQIIANREADLLDEMVLVFRNGKATFEYLIGRISAISELRTLESAMDRAARQAIAKVEATS